MRLLRMLRPHNKHAFTLSKVEIFYLECQLTNPKDMWNEFTFVDNTNFDFSITVSLLNQKSTNYFVLEKRKNNKRICFGFKRFAEDIAFKNWLNRKSEFLNLKSPAMFQKLVSFSHSTNVEFLNAWTKKP